MTGDLLDIPASRVVALGARPALGAAGFAGLHGSRTAARRLPRKDVCSRPVRGSSALQIPGVHGTGRAMDTTSDHASVSTVAGTASPAGNDTVDGVDDPNGADRADRATPAPIPGPAGDPADVFLDVAGIAARYDISRSKAYEVVDTDGFPASVVPGMKRIPLVALQAP